MAHDVTTEGGSGGGIPPGIHTYTGTSKSPSEAVFIITAQSSNKKSILNAEYSARRIVWRTLGQYG